jgi:hypothetical protein
MALHYIKLQYSELHSITLPYIELHYSRLHYMHAHIQTHTHPCIFMYIHSSLYICIYDYLCSYYFPKIIRSKYTCMWVDMHMYMYMCIIRKCINVYVHVHV